jgi:hypothetical protein
MLGGFKFTRQIRNQSQKIIAGSNPQMSLYYVLIPSVFCTIHNFILHLTELGKFNIA